MKETTDFELLKILREENNFELRFWRERSWNAMKLIITAFLGLAGASLFKEKSAALGFLVVGLAVVGTLYLRKNFMRYQERRVIGARIDTAMGFFEKGRFLPEDGLLPGDMKEPKAAKAGSGSFIAAVWIIALATLLAILATWYSGNSAG